MSGPVTVGIRPTLPVEGVSLLLGNDLAGEKVMINPCLSSLPCEPDSTNETIPGLFPACAVTRAMAKQAKEQSPLLLEKQADPHDVNLSDTFLAQAHPDQHDETLQMGQDNNEFGKYPVSTKQLIEKQEADPAMTSLLQEALCESEASKVPTCFYKRSGVLMRKWRPPTVSSDEEWQVNHQIVVPTCYRGDILSLAHESPLAGHLGINKTYQKVLSHFYWPGLHKDVVKFCKSCHVCQVVGKPNQQPPIAPLKPIPAVESHSVECLLTVLGPFRRLNWEITIC